jgi:hypothetical protein
MARAAITRRARGGPTNAKREAIIHDALAAWNGIIGGRGDRWPLWSPVCVGLRLCRDDAMRSIGLDPREEETPTDNGRYNSAMTRALADTGLNAIYRSTRKAAVECGGWLKEIERWRDELRTSPEESERSKWLNLQHPQKMWLEFCKYQGWNQKEPTEKTFLQVVVKKALQLENGQIAQGLASNLTTRRLYAIATAMLDRLDVPMRPITSSALDVPPDSKHEAILAMLDKLGWDASERSRLSDALSFGQSDRESAYVAALEARIEELTAKETPEGEADLRLAGAHDEIASLKQRIEELEQAMPPVSTTAEWATGDQAAKQIADLTDRLHTVEAQLLRHHDEQFADGADPVPKAVYKDAADKARIALEAAEQHIREQEAERDDWRKRTHAELDQQYRGRTAKAEHERDEAVQARDVAVLKHRAAETQIAAMKEPFTLERFTEAQKDQHAKMIQKLAELRQKHAMKGDDNETSAPEPHSD